jgi:hypothetical protein
MTDKNAPDVHFLSSGLPPGRLNIALDLLIDYLLEFPEFEQQDLENDQNTYPKDAISPSSSPSNETANLENQLIRTQLLQVIQRNLAS